MSITQTPTAPDVTLNGVPVSQCLALVEAVKNNPDAGQTRWRSSTTWRGGFACESRIREHVVILDEPSALGGSNTAPNMVEAVLAAYGSCLTVGYTLNAAIRGIEVRSLEVDVEGHIDLAGFFGLSADVPAGFTGITASVRLDADATPAQLQDLHAHVLATSPVGSILQRPIDVTTDLVPTPQA
jgi:uncharacterized OsmC-like protein